MAQTRRNAIIRAWLDFTGTSISELGRRVSGQSNAVKDILSGKVANPTWRTLQAIARHIGVQMEDLTDVNRPAPQFRYGPDACGHARIHVPEAAIARNERQELDFVPFPGNGIEARLDQVEHLSMAGAGALRVWKVWHETNSDDLVRTFDSYLVDIADREPSRTDEQYVVIEALADVVLRTKDQIIGDERVIGRICGSAT